MKRYLAKSVSDLLMQVSALFWGTFAEGCQDFWEVRNESFLEDFSCGAEDLQVLPLLLQFHVVVGFGEQTEK